ncbi:hypothetical protein OTU49_017528 [Cherax quadricarinatus]|uniref:Uncharacterized protein n=1 Tax=Cherax quadricarinatus TaxID=27406 RepID=A0AAW0XWY5_CHEQU
MVSCEMVEVPGRQAGGLINCEVEEGWVIIQPSETCSGKKKQEPSKKIKPSFSSVASQIEYEKVTQCVSSVASQTEFETVTRCVSSVASQNESEKTNQGVSPLSSRSNS